MQHKFHEMDKNPDYEAQDTRIRNIFSSNFEEPRRTIDTIRFYKEYLIRNVTLPCVLTGIEDFGWEEFYLLGPGDKAEYESMKKDNPSHTDYFDLRSFKDEIDEYEGIMVNVQRKSDEMHFILPLANLHTIEFGNKNAELIDDYSDWFVNY